MINEDRFWARVDASGDCWEWISTRNERGYGRLVFDGHKHSAPRVAWELLVGPIPSGMEPDHLCRNPPCVNPDHLEIVTHAENTRRGIVGINNRLKTHCPKGHEYSEANTFVRSGSRHCRTCRIASCRAWRQRERIK